MIELKARIEQRLGQTPCGCSDAWCHDRRIPDGQFCESTSHQVDRDLLRDVLTRLDAEQIAYEGLKQQAEKWLQAQMTVKLPLSNLEVEARDVMFAIQHLTSAQDERAPTEGDEVARLERQIDRLLVDIDHQRTALRQLMKESAAIVALAEHELRQAVGNTNLAVFNQRIQEAGAVLAGQPVVNLMESLKKALPVAAQDERAPKEGWRPIDQRHIADMRRASQLVDEAAAGPEHQARMYALALIARQFLRNLPNPPVQEPR